MRIVLVVGSVLAAVLACGLPGTGISSLMEAPRASTATVQIDTSITTPPLNAIIPPGLATGASSSVTTEVEFPYINPSLGAMPAHSKYILETYALGGSLHQPQVLVFEAEGYGQYSELTRGVITALRSPEVIASRPLPNALYAGPFAGQIEDLKFRNGTGLRYLTQAGQAPEPIHNEGLFYFFQGVTTDGAYYIAAVLPTSAEFLVKNADPTSPLPDGGIAFDYERFETLPEYFEAISTKLNVTGADGFAPSLAILDAFVESFLIQP